MLRWVFRGGGTLHVGGSTLSVGEYIDCALSAYPDRCPVTDRSVCLSNIHLPTAPTSIFASGQRFLRSW